MISRLDVLQLGLSAGQRRELVLQRLEVLGGAGAGIETGAVARGAVADRWTSASDFSTSR